MAKKYLSLEEAASLLGLSVDAVRRAREKGDLRGFQDRGSWKFREQDIDEFRRSRQADSSPDMPMLSNDGGVDLSSSDSDVRLMADPGDDDLGDLINTGSDSVAIPAPNWKRKRPFRILTATSSCSALTFLAATVTAM